MTCVNLSVDWLVKARLRSWNKERKEKRRERVGMSKSVELEQRKIPWIAAQREIGNIQAASTQ